MSEIINEELMIKSCGIGDLTLSQTNQFLALWNDDSTISKLTLFYDDEGYIVINKDRENFEALRFLTETYMSGDKGVRELMWDKYPKFEEEFRVIDAAIRKREEDLFFKMVDNSILYDEAPMLSAIIRKHGDGFLTISRAFAYGVIHGKKIERAKKRKVVNA